jgi:hypothetical protein
LRHPPGHPTFAPDGMTPGRLWVAYQPGWYGVGSGLQDEAVGGRFEVRHHSGWYSAPNSVRDRGELDPPLPGLVSGMERRVGAQITAVAAAGGDLPPT